MAQAVSSPSKKGAKGETTKAAAAAAAAETSEHASGTNSSSSSSSSSKASPPPHKVKTSALENPFLHLSIVVAAIAIGVYFGMEHRRKGVDLVSSLLFDNKAAGKTAFTRSPETQPDQVPRHDSVLPRPIRVQVHANGEAAHPATVTLDPRHVMSLHDLKRETGKHIKGCHAGTCRVFDQYGYEVSSLEALQDDHKLFLVLPGRLFVWPGFHVGYKTEAPGVPSASKDQPITLTTLSLSPRVFSIENFLSPEDADELIETALNIKEPDFALKRSSTGTRGAEVSSQRTSENAFDTSSPVAMKLKRRVFDLLGIRPYDETWADGLQVLRYNKTRAYVAHLDYLESHPLAKHDFDSGGKGTNRFATVLLYLTDVESGGETVFINGKAVDGTAMSDDDALAMGLTKDLEVGSWEEKLTADCRTKLAVKPKKAMAALFYSQKPDGKVDTNSLHGGCPVLEGTKWAANLWVWNGPRYGYGPADDYSADGGDTPKSMEAEFTSDVDGVQLYWQDSVWGPMGPDLPPLRVNTFEGHVWNVRRGEEQLHTFTMTPGDSVYTYRG